MGMIKQSMKAFTFVVIRNVSPRVCLHLSYHYGFLSQTVQYGSVKARREALLTNHIARFFRIARLSFEKVNNAKYQTKADNSKEDGEDKTFSDMVYQMLFALPVSEEKAMAKIEFQQKLVLLKYRTHVSSAPSLHQLSTNRPSYQTFGQVMQRCYGSCHGEEGPTSPGY